MLLAFVSQRSLTGYDNTPVEPNACIDIGSRDGLEPGPCKEVYLYDASSGGLTCVSCDSSGERPIGEASLNNIELDEQELYKHHQFSEDGSLFFQSSDPLVPHDSNGRQDVYEYLNGHVYPLSNDAGGHDSFFLDVSASGSDVFIATADRLLAQDTDTRLDIYDVRVEGGFPVSVFLPVCDNGDACKPPPTAQPGVFGRRGARRSPGRGISRQHRG